MLCNFEILKEKPLSFLGKEIEFTFTLMNDFSRTTYV